MNPMPHQLVTKLIDEFNAIRERLDGTCSIVADYRLQAVSDLAESALEKIEEATPSWGVCRGVWREGS